MKKLPIEVQAKIDILNTYAINKDLKYFDIIHLYAEKNAYPNGYYDSKFFTLIIFNTKTKEKNIIENRDGISFYNHSIDISMIRIYVDGSTMIKFKTLKQYMWGQDVVIY